MSTLCVALSYCAHLKLYERILNNETFLDIVLSEKDSFLRLLTTPSKELTSILLLTGIVLKKGVVHQDLTLGERAQIVTAYQRFDICRYYDQYKDALKKFHIEYAIKDHISGMELFVRDEYCYLHRFRVLKNLTSEKHAMDYFSTLYVFQSDQFIAECIAGELLMLPGFDRAYTQAGLDNLMRYAQDEPNASPIKLFKLFLDPSSSLSEKLFAASLVSKKRFIRLVCKLGSKSRTFFQDCIDANAGFLTKLITLDYASVEHFPILGKLSHVQLSTLVSIPVSCERLNVVRYWFIQASFYPSLKSPVFAKYIMDSLSSTPDAYFLVTSRTCPSATSPDAQHLTADSTDLDGGDSSSSNSTCTAATKELPEDVLFKIFTFINEGNIFQLHFVIKNVCWHWNKICTSISGDILRFTEAYEMLKSDGHYLKLDTDKVLTIYPWKSIFNHGKQCCVLLKDIISNSQMKGSVFNISNLVKSFSSNQDLLTPSLLASAYCKFQEDSSSLLIPKYFTDEQIVETLKSIAIDKGLEIRLSHEYDDIYDMIENRNVFGLLMADREMGLKVLGKLVIREHYLSPLVASTNPGKHPLEFLNRIFRKPIQSKDEIDDRRIEILAKHTSAVYFSLDRPVGSIELLIKYLGKGYEPNLPRLAIGYYIRLLHAVLIARPSVESFKLVCDSVLQGVISPKNVFLIIVEWAFSKEKEKILEALQCREYPSDQL